MKCQAPLVFLCLIAVCGCSSKPSGNSGGGATNTGDPHSSKAATTDQIANDSKDAVSGIELAIDSPPELVCHCFIDRLQHGNLLKAEKMLTQKAMQYIRECNLELSAPGGPDATYRYLTPEYATSQQKVAFVPCVVVENGDTQEFSLMLKRGEFGWKIAGMLMQMDKSKDLFSFENPNDVARIKAMIGSDDGTHPANQPVEHLAQNESENAIH